MSRPLPALTVHQPFAHLLAIGEKPVENREWPPPPQIVGGYLAIHAGKTVDVEAYETLTKKLAARPRPALWTGRTAPALPPPEEVQLSAIVAVARVVGAIFVRGAADGIRLEVCRMFGAGLSRERAEEFAASPYAFGPWCWCLEEVVRLPVPIPCRGAQKIWTVPEHEADLVRAGWRTATAAAARSATP